MATAVEKPVAVATRSHHDLETPPKKKKQIVAAEAQEEDPYTRLKTLQRQYEFLDIQESYIKEEQRNLKRELLRAQEEVKRIQSVPLVIGQFLEMVDANTGIALQCVG